MNSQGAAVRPGAAMRPGSAMRSGPAVRPGVGSGAARRRRPGDGRGDGGWVTVEFAACSLLVAAVFCLLAWVGGLLALQLRVTDAAAQIARQEARGDSTAVAAAKKGAPEGSVVEINRLDGRVTVVVRCTPQSVLPWLPAPAITSSATVQQEPGQ